MRLFRIGSTQVVCSIPVLLCVPVMIIFKLTDTLAVSVISLSLHELSHVLAARRLGYRVLTVELWPFGFVARLAGRIKTGDELFIFASGVLFSLITGLCASALCNYFPSVKNTLTEFAAFNVGIGLVNLLPALPLDGGRMLRAILQKLFSQKTSTLICIALGICISTLMLLFGVHMAVSGSVNLTLFTMGIFLLTGAFRERKTIDGANVHAMLQKCSDISSGSAFTVEQIAMHGSIFAADAQKLMRPSRYCIVLVVDEYMNAVGTLNENDLLFGAAKGLRLFELLACKREKTKAFINIKNI